MIHFGVDQFMLYSGSMDMRKGINTLCAVIQGELGRDPSNGEAFVFINKSKKILKLVIWKSGGYWLCQKRLSRGTFQTRSISTVDGKALALQLTALEWQALLDGVVMQSNHRLERFDSTDKNSK